MFGIGEGELAIIVVFGFLLFGPDKLPQMGRTIGRAIRQFRETQEKMTAVVQSEIIDPVSEAASAPVKPKKLLRPTTIPRRTRRPPRRQRPPRRRPLPSAVPALLPRRPRARLPPRARVLLRRPRVPSLPLPPSLSSSPSLLQNRSPSPSR
ncbi:MAG: twin-arginine translocase TatA/TatE family subunit [Collinsella aerofaciens]